MMPFPIGGLDRRRNERRDAMADQARDLRERAGSLIGLEAEVRNEQRRLDQQQADLAVREHALRRREAQLAEREQVNVRREDRIAEHDRATSADDAEQRAVLLRQHTDRQRAATVQAILRAGAARRAEGDDSASTAPPKGSLAERILAAAKKARGET